MIDIVTVFRRSLANLAPSLSASVLTLCLAWGCFAISAARGQTPPSDPQTSPLPANWREIKEGVGGYPAGPMLEIAVRHTHADKLEMFQWRSEFIAMLSAQPGPLVEREWRSVWSLPENTGAGTWTGMTWWENQQRWQDMANMLFPTPVAANWLQTLDMTLIFVKPLDRTFDLRTLAQSGGQVLELGLLVFPTSAGHEPAAMLKLSRRPQGEGRGGLPFRRLSQSDRLQRPFHRRLQAERTARHRRRTVVRLHGELRHRQRHERACKPPTRSTAPSKR